MFNGRRRAGGEEGGDIAILSMLGDLIEGCGVEDAEVEDALGERRDSGSHVREQIVQVGVLHLHVKVSMTICGVVGNDIPSTGNDTGRGG